MADAALGRSWIEDRTTADDRIVLMKEGSMILWGPRAISTPPMFLPGLQYLIDVYQSGFRG
jgi:hypothetical protein